MTLLEKIDSCGFGQECVYRDYEVFRLINGGFQVKWGYGNYGMRLHDRWFPTIASLETWLKGQGIDPEKFVVRYDPSLFNGL